jgi:hypothetical protein
MANLDPKGKRDNSMSGKQWPPEGVKGGVLRDPRDTVKAGLLEAQSLFGVFDHPPERRL